MSYTLSAQSASGLSTLLSTQGAGRYEVRFSGSACSGGDWSSAQVALITLNPNLAFPLRFHYRDHLGSSTVSRAYTPEYQTGIAGTSAFNLKMSALGNQFVTLYAQPEKATNFTPFGKPMGDVNEEPNPRYTDHEFDAESGLNYMQVQRNRSRKSGQLESRNECSGRPLAVADGFKRDHKVGAPSSRIVRPFVRPNRDAAARVTQ